MNRPQLEHIIRAAAANAGVRDIIVIGSQSILGAHPNAPSELLESIEADVFPRDVPERSIVIDGAMGELSMFHDTFGYYAHGIDETTAVLPEGWRDRLIKVESSATMGAIGWCLEPHDLAVSKLAAGREKDVAFVEALVRNRLVSVELVRARLNATSTLTPQLRQRAIEMLDGLSKT